MTDSKILESAAKILCLPECGYAAAYVKYNPEDIALIVRIGDEDEITVDPFGHSQSSYEQLNALEKFFGVETEVYREGHPANDKTVDIWRTSSLETGAIAEENDPTEARKLCIMKCLEQVA